MYPSETLIKARNGDVTELHGYKDFVEMVKACNGFAEVGRGGGELAIIGLCHRAKGREVRPYRDRERSGFTLWERVDKPAAGPALS